jgi:uroporphyrinogen III methyltransferase/synthase
VSAAPRAAGAGRVILVGAGPGDPDLITVRGAAALREADAVVYDALASTELLELAPASALRIDVGKRGHDAPTRAQEEINALLVRLAREGRKVVRLKGGDPFIFGRGGEEASACAAAGIDFEVVPGISAAVGALAYAGIPVTDRRHAASFAVVTGHKDPTLVSRETRWEALARAADTLVIVMGMRNLETIAAKILAGGLDPATPAAVVMDGALPTQRVVEAPLGELVARTREAGLAAPAVVVVGRVVGLRSELAWYERLPLFGMRVLVSRPEGQAGELASALRAAGARPELLPLIRIEPPTDASPADAALASLDGYDALLFTSANAVRAVAERARLRGLSLGAFEGRVFCVGPRTAEAARAAGLCVEALPERNDAEGLAAQIAARRLPAGQRYLLPRAEEGREILPERLREGGAVVDAVAVYRTVPAAVDAEALCGRLARGEIGALTFTSPSTVRSFAGLLDAPAREAIRSCLVAAIGPVTAQALRRRGIEPDAVPAGAGAAELVEALTLAARRRQGGSA